VNFLIILIPFFSESQTANIISNCFSDEFIFNSFLELSRLKIFLQTDQFSFFYPFLNVRFLFCSMFENLISVSEAASILSNLTFLRHSHKFGKAFAKSFLNFFQKNLIVDGIIYPHLYQSHVTMIKSTFDSLVPLIQKLIVKYDQNQIAILNEVRKFCISYNFHQKALAQL
jgi:hypothetical protein